MTGKTILQSFIVVATIALFGGVGVSSAFAANQFLDVNGATAGDGIVNGSTYAWSTSANSFWSSSTAGTVATVAWNQGNVAFFGGMIGDLPGWNYIMSQNNDATASTPTGGINVGSVSAGTVTMTGNVNYHINATTQTWTVAANSWLIDNIATSNGAVNLNGKTLFLAGAGNVTFGGSGLDHESSILTDNLTGVLSLNTAARTSFDAISTLNLGFGTLNIGDPFGPGSAKLVIGSSNATVSLDNTSGGPMTLTSTGAPIIISNNFNFLGSNNLTFAGNSPVTLTVTPTITVVNNTLTIPDTIGGGFGINKAGAGTLVLGAANSFGSSGGTVSVSDGSLALNAANSYTGGTTVFSGTLSMGADGALGSGGVTVQSGGVLAVAATVTSQLGSGIVTIQPSGLLDTSAGTGYAMNGGALTIQPGGLLNTSAGTGFTMNGGAFTAGRTAGFAADINGNLNLNNAIVNVAGNNVVGTMTVNGGLSLSGDTLSYDAGDQIAVTGGSVALNNTTYIVPNSALSSGTYALFNNYTSLTGGTSNLAMAGAFGTNPRQQISFDFSSGIAVNLVVTGSAGDLQWTGGTNSVWDTGASQNWLNVSAGSADFFYTGDNVTFNDTPGTATTVNISGAVQPGSINVSATGDYTFSGTGSIIGTTSLQIAGPGALTINTSNTYSGGTIFNGGTLNLGHPSALGTGPLAIGGGILDNTSGSAMTLAGNNSQTWSGSFTFQGSSPLNMGSGAVTLVGLPTVNVNAGTLTVGGVMSGAGGGITLTTNTAGVLLLTNSNLYTGATTILAGTLQLGTGLVGQDGSINSTSSVINSGALIYNLAGNQTVPYHITTTGTMTKLGSGNLTLGIASSYSGSTAVNGGILTLNVGNALSASAITVASGAELDLNASDALGAANTNPLTVFGLVKKISNQSETIFRPITLSGGTMTATGGAGGATPGDGSWDFFGPASGTTITTASGTTNFFTGTGGFGIFSVRMGTSYFSLGANSTLNVSVPILQNHNTGSPNCNITGPGSMIFSGNNFYGTAGTNAYVTSGTATVFNVGYNSLAGNLLLAGSLTFPITTAATDTTAPADRNDGYFNVGYGSTLTISNSANVNVQGDLKLGTTASGSSGTANQTGGTLAVTGVDTANGSRSLVIGEFANETSAYNLSAGSLSVPNGWTYLGYSGSGVLNVSGGTATLLGINFGAGQGGAMNLSGNGLLSIGTSGISNNNANSSATISGGTLQTNSNWSVNMPMTFNGPATVSFNGNTIGINGAISGSGSLALIGPGGVLLLGGSNSYSGGTTVPAGFTVRVGNNNALGTGSLYLNGGAVSANGVTSYTLASPVVLSSGTLGDTVNSGGLTFTAASGTLAQNVALTVNSPVAINGNLTDGGSGFTLTKNGIGALTLAGNNTFSGSVAVSAGKLYINGTNAIPSIFVAQGATLGGSGTAASAAVTVDGGANLASAGNLDLSPNAGGTLTFSSLTFNNFGTITLPLLSSTATLALQAGTLTVNGFANSVQFSLAPTQNSIANGTYRLLGYSGAIGGGAGGFGAFSIPPLNGRQTGTLVNNPGEIDYTVLGYTPYWNGQQPDWKSTNAWTLNPSGSLTTFQGGDNDVFDDSGTTGGVGASVVINQGNVKPFSVVFNSTTAAYTISGSNGIAGSAYLQINGGGLTINNSNGYTSGTQFNAGTLNLNNPSAIAGGPLTISGGTLGNTSGGSIGLTTNNVQAWNGDFTFNGPYNLNLGTGAVTLSGTRTVTLAAGNLTVGGPVGGSGASLTVAGNGNLILAGANTYNSGTLILGGNLTATDNNSPLGSGPLTMSPASGAATLNLTGSGPTISSLSSGGAGTSTIVLGNAANSSATTLTINNAAANTFGGTIGDLSQTNSAAVGNVVFNGAGTFVLSGSNTYTGSTTVTSGILQLGSATALYAGSATGNANINGTLDLNGYNAAVGGLSGSGNVLSSVPATATLTAGANNANSTFTGSLAASLLGLTKSGTGNLTLTGTNGVSNITISQGTLQIGNGGTTGSIPATATIADNGALVYNYGVAGPLVALPLAGFSGTGSIAVNTAVINTVGNTVPGAITLLSSITTGGYQSYISTATTVARASGIMIGNLAANPSATVTLSTTAAGSSITLTGNVGQNFATTPQNLVLDTSAVNGTINLNVSIGHANIWFSLGAFTANAGTGAINWVGTTVNGVNNYQFAANGTNTNQTTPITLTGAINFASNFLCYSALPMTLNPTAPSTLSGVLSEARVSRCRSLSEGRVF